MDQSLPKKQRLVGKKQFESVFEEGKHVQTKQLKLIYLRTRFNDGSPVKAAFVAPKKRFRKAVRRNRIKRLLREAYRLNKHLIFNNIEGNFAFVFLYLGKDLPNFKQIDEEIKTVLNIFLKKESHEKNQ
ncbi:ribonuclease P protein component [Allomuricauda sp. SCSIO 65647]|uniref:ribonuclease P protein component n=1 Tax=Allomuricauda sp. SCSIO 65647 TaxID=2908843 RepID=UPI001F17AE98|nr:ribonuclease P protein component [Muricauda sp. SCSIO 65647]UJH69097.1 ribonuclease P protein component [Muricauda sp. SCSIO 65647]